MSREPDYENEEDRPVGYIPPLGLGTLTEVIRRKRAVAKASKKKDEQMKKQEASVGGEGAQVETS